MGNRFGFPDLGVGLGLRTTHYPYLLEHFPEVGWFEIISENFLATSGRPLLVLDRIAERYPIVMHGVSLSIGSSDPVDFEYLGKLAALRDRTGARWISDHLCWTGVGGVNSHDLLPMLYTEETLALAIAKVKQVQDFLGQRIALENPSSYVEFAASTLSEPDFLRELASGADCALLLDVNNVFVSSQNHDFDPLAYLAKIPHDRVVQFHVAGHTVNETHIVDTHIGPVVDPVWELLRVASELGGCRSTLLEWDAEIPEFEVVLAEARRADAYLAPPKGAAS